MSASERARAARNVASVLRDRTVDRALASGSQTPLSLELTYGVLRRFFSLSAEVDGCLQQPLRDLEVRALLLVGAYQLRHTRIPSHAALNETVSACRTIGRPWARGLVNGVLRQLDRNRSAPGRDEELAFDHPRWLIDALRTEYGDRATVLLEANNERAPMTLRVNQARETPIGYRARLTDAGLSHAPGWLEETVVLQTPMPTSILPGWADGLVAVQDAGAQFAAVLLEGELPREGRMLDACAAPGGTAFHLLERMHNLDLTAMDRSSDRLATLATEASRLGHTPRVVCADAARPDAWWDGVPFDAVLCDAPCTGTGTLRRHPDIKVRCTNDRVADHLAAQSALLDGLWRVLRAGGTLLYCTCSLLQEENDAIVGSFVNARPDAVAGAITLPTGMRTRYGWQLLPTEPLTDGFYYALIRKSV
jgi:16S rRNA (cytosine967-C5)-methyltransferase